MQHVTHDFSEPEIDDYFGGDDKVQKLDVLHLETMNQYVVYWIEDQKYAVNNSLYAKWGISYRGKILVFKRRSDAMRFSTMRRYHVEQVMECVKWCVNVTLIYINPSLICRASWLNGRESIARV